MSRRYGKRIGNTSSRFFSFIAKLNDMLNNLDLLNIRDEIEKSKEIIEHENDSWDEDVTYSSTTVTLFVNKIAGKVTTEFFFTSSDGETFTLDGINMIGSNEEAPDGLVGEDFSIDDVLDFLREGLTTLTIEYNAPDGEHLYTTDVFDLQTGEHKFHHN